MFSYVAYGLGIHSALPLPELLPQPQAPAEVRITLGTVDKTRLQVVDEWHRFWASREAACHFFADAGAFLVRDGCEIVVEPLPQADLRAIRLSILGPAMALVLHQRQRLVLHASAVEVAGGAVAFLGHHGWGKSTMAAALHQRGHPMLTDDVTAIARDSGGFRVLPSFPQGKLWPDAMAALGVPPDACPLVHPALEKRAYRMTRNFTLAPVPIARLYVLEEGPVLASRSLPPQEAVQALLAHWYGGRFGRHLLQGTDLAAHFRHCTDLAQHVSLRRLQRPAGLAALADVARFVEEDLAHDAC